METVCPREHRLPLETACPKSRHKKKLDNVEKSSPGSICCLVFFLLFFLNFLGSFFLGVFGVVRPPYISLNTDWFLSIHQLLPAIDPNYFVLRFWAPLTVLFYLVPTGHNSDKIEMYFLFCHPRNKLILWPFNFHLY